jgi:hypothetical protein
MKSSGKALQSNAAAIIVMRNPKFESGADSWPIPGLSFSVPRDFVEREHAFI